MSVEKVVLPFALVAVLLTQGAFAQSRTLTVTGAAPDGRGGVTLRETRLSYDPAALGDPEGVPALYDRIVAAAENVCRLPDGIHAPGRYDDKLATCRHRAVKAAVETLAAPLLTQQFARTAEK